MQPMKNTQIRIFQMKNVILWTSLILYQKELSHLLRGMDF